MNKLIAAMLVVPPKVAARAIHLDRRLSQVVQVQVSSQIPLITQ